MSQKILSRIDADGNATVLLNRPEAHNAFDPEMVDALTATYRKLGADTSVRTVVLAGAGDNFCAGADIAHMKKSAKFTRAQNLDNARAMAAMFQAIQALPKPTIACVTGAVRGGGLGLVAACDIAIATRNATFRLSEVRLGIVPAVIGPYVIAAVGARMARRYMLTAEEFDVAEAFRIGLVHDICEPAELTGKVGQMLGWLYAGGPGALAEVKRLVPVMAASSLDAALVETTAQSIATMRATPEAQEGLSAFLEKRQPRWLAPPARKKKGVRKRAS